MPCVTNCRAFQPGNIAHLLPSSLHIDIIFLNQNLNKRTSHVVTINVLKFDKARPIESDCIHRYLPPGNEVVGR